SRLEARGKGILLLHDIHHVTVAALPELLSKLKAAGFHVVHIVPGTGEQAEVGVASASREPTPSSSPNATPAATTQPGAQAAASNKPTPPERKDEAQPVAAMPPTGSQATAANKEPAREAENAAKQAAEAAASSNQAAAANSTVPSQSDTVRPVPNTSPADDQVANANVSPPPGNEYDGLVADASKSADSPQATS